MTDAMVTYATLNWNYSKMLVLHNIRIVSRDKRILFNEFKRMNLSELKKFILSTAKEFFSRIQCRAVHIF